MNGHRVFYELTPSFLRVFYRAKPEWNHMSIGVFIYFDPGLPCGLDELEEALESAFRDRGEVTGTGIGNIGSNIDLQITDQYTDDDILLSVRQSLADYDHPNSINIVMQA